MFECSKLTISLFSDTSREFVLADEAIGVVEQFDPFRPTILASVDEPARVPLFVVPDPTGAVLAPYLDDSATARDDPITCLKMPARLRVEWPKPFRHAPPPHKTAEIRRVRAPLIPNMEPAASKEKTQSRHDSGVSESAPPLPFPIALAEIVKPDIEKPR